MQTTCPRLIISATKGGSGKTFVTLGLLAAWRRHLAGSGSEIPAAHVASFKKGPDFIDAAWLAMAAEWQCHNLDLFLMGRQQTLSSFVYRCQGAKGALIEGNRGLFDGIDVAGSNSTAELAKLLDAPVLLIVDCTMATRTVASVVLGAQHLDPGIRIAGVILNRVTPGRHEKVIRGSIERHCEVPVVGAIPKIAEESFPERHMGLIPPFEHRRPDGAVERAYSIIRDCLDIATVLTIADSAPPVSCPTTDPLFPGEVDVRQISRGRPVIGVIRDAAFQFYYPENLEALERADAEIRFVNALEDKELPGIDGLYIGGGFPETHAGRLAGNTTFRHSLNAAVERGLPVYAECGGLMFLGEKILYQEREYPMVGVLPISFGFRPRPGGHGYTIVEVSGENPFLPVGLRFHGHEFHYSYVNECDRKKLKFVFKVERGMGIMDGLDGLTYKNVVATYTHLHALGVKEWARGIVRCALKS